MTKIQSLIAALRDAGVPAEFWHTGGGCYAIGAEIPGGAELLITGEDVFQCDDLTSDANVNGEWYVQTCFVDEPDGTEQLFTTDPAEVVRVARAEFDKA